MILSAVFAVLAIGFWPPSAARSYDYCAAPAANSLVDRYLKDPSSIRPQPFAVPKPAHRISPGGNPERVDLLGPDDPDAFRIILVPVGYEQGVVAVRLRELASSLQKAFEPVGHVQFGYVSPSVDLSFSHIDRLLIADQGQIEQFRKRGARAAQADALIFVLNSQEYAGTAYGGYAVVAGQVADPPIVHETGHVLGLDDGYDRYYGPDGLHGTELFFDVNSIPPHAAEAYQRLWPDIEQAGTCGGRIVYRFAGSRYTVMAYGDTFSTMQIAIMAKGIQERRAKKRSR